jgi:carbon-monoxide dehydrogenase small subunit
VKVQFTLNGEATSVELPPLSRLLDALRGPLELTGTKEGCGEGECGTCAVFLDGVPVNACLIAVGQCEGREIVTVEGLARGAHLTHLQQCMVDHGGAQCGICTPGMLIAAEALLRRNDKPNDHDIRQAIAGNLCRCTGYERIVQSVLEAAKLRRES